MFTKMVMAAALAVSLSGCVVAVGGNHEFDDDSSWKKRSGKIRRKLIT